ncbi:beta-hexosaminidase [Sesbania bispinosa]|nr:beta-hexosaminidase [Sesbania bispinosa]
MVRLFHHLSPDAIAPTTGSRDNIYDTLTPMGNTWRLLLSDTYSSSLININCLVRIPSTMCPFLLTQ